MHVIKNVLLQPACSPRHLRVQTIAGREDENLRANANAGCVYLALRQMVLEQAKEGRSWSERKVKTLSNDLGLPQKCCLFKQLECLLECRGFTMRMASARGVNSSCA
jgi:hypothetical protein